MAEAQIVNPLGAFGYTDFTSKGYKVVAPFKAEAAITGPAVVAINTTGNVATAATNGTASLCVGICINSPAAGGVAEVVIAGIAENVPVSGTIAAGEPMIRSGTTAGRVVSSSAPAAGEALGVAINAGSAANGTVDVWVKFFG